MSTRSVIFKKITTDKSVVFYMGKRDFVDNVNSVEPVDGVLLIDPGALDGRKAFVTLSCTFRYGRDDMDVMGIVRFTPRSRGKLLRKLGDNAYPFFFEFPDNLPCSVGLQPGPHDSGKQCAVEFEIKAFSAESQDAKIRKRSAVKLMLRKVQYAPETDEPAEPVTRSRDFVTADKPLHLEVTLEKDTFYHGEAINVNVSVTNNSNKNIKNIIVSVDQLRQNPWPSRILGMQSPPEQVSKRSTPLLPLLADNKERRGIALDGKLKHEDTTWHPQACE
ncbi:unnamed protein product [Arctogadus glacialis]